MKLNNRFDILELQQPIESEDHQDQEPLEKRELPVSEDEDIFAHFCFLMDCHRIRKQITSIWEQYRDNKVSVVVAALTTNVAFDNIEKLYNELVAVCKRYPS